ncbi:MAG TPA: DUF4296 domain-containing protein [Flavobacteriales bacterium]|nr:DUF4296 domain-containing protein [Flavobacteriales bacterium]
MRIALLTIALFMFACGQETSTPEGMLEKQAFAEVLAGATLIEARMNDALTVEMKGSFPVEAEYDSLFKAKGVTREQFKSTFDHYAARPGELKAVYDDVLALLSQWKDEAAQGAPMTKEDTLVTDSVKLRKG